MIDGYDDGTFKPNRIISKAEATKILLNISMIRANNIQATSYEDIQVNSWQYDYITNAEALRLFNPENDNLLFHPEDGVSRSQMLELIDELLQLY